MCDQCVVLKSKTKPITSSKHASPSDGIIIEPIVTEKSEYHSPIGDPGIHDQVSTTDRPTPRSSQISCVGEGTAAAVPPPFRFGDPVLCGSHPLVTTYQCLFHRLRLSLLQIKCSIISTTLCSQHREPNTAAKHWYIDNTFKVVKHPSVQLLYRRASVHKRQRY